ASSTRHAGRPPGTQKEERHAMTARTPSPQQAAVYEFVRTGRGNAILIAVAGAGKTTTLETVCATLARQPRCSVVYCAFNKKNADEFTAKLARQNIDWRSVK